MAQQNRTTLKTYFNTGDTPTEAQFADFVDSCFNPSNDTLDAIPEGTTYKLFTPAERTKLSGIEAAADVTDTSNVTAAGALMDSECASLVDVKALNQSVVSGASPTFGTGNMTDATNRRFMTDAQETKLDSVETNADVTDAANVSAAGAPIISSGAGAPASTPSKVGDIYIDTTNDDAYTAVGTASSADWEKNNASGSANSLIASVGITIDGGGSAITTGVKGYIEIPYACTINRVTMLADVSGSIVVDIWKDTYANYPPLVGDTITASAKPTISSATKSQDSTLTGWTTSVSAGDILAFKVDSASTVTRVHLILKVTKT